MRSKLYMRRRRGRDEGPRPISEGIEFRFPDADPIMVSFDEYQKNARRNMERYDSYPRWKRDLIKKHNERPPEPDE